MIEFGRQHESLMCPIQLPLAPSKWSVLISASHLSALMSSCYASVASNDSFTNVMIVDIFSHPLGSRVLSTSRVEFPLPPQSPHCSMCLRGHFACGDRCGCGVAWDCVHNSCQFRVLEGCSLRRTCQKRLSPLVKAAVFLSEIPQRQWRRHNTFFCR